MKRLRFRALHGKMPMFKKRIGIVSCDVDAVFGTKACVQVPCVQNIAFAFVLLDLLSLCFLLMVCAWVAYGDFALTLPKGVCAASRKALRSKTATSKTNVLPQQ